MDRYDPLKIEAKWQAKWAESEPFKATEHGSKPKKYLAEMFPYPSAIGLHVGHVRNFTIVDVLARYYTQRGFNVLRPFGYDTFGLPAENYAIKTGTAPQAVTAENISNFRKQAQRLGFAIDWSREINTSDPEYYRWTEWCFLQLFKKGLAYQKESYQWWCPVDQTVLANEQVENGHCWRCGHEVEKKKMKQWFFKITAYADELLDSIDSLDWPEKIKTMQKNWIGRSEGALVKFKVALDSETTDGRSEPTEVTRRLVSEGNPQSRRGLSGEPALNSDVTEGRSEPAGRAARSCPVKTGAATSQAKGASELSAGITVFTTRPDTLAGATFLVLAPEHPLIGQITTPAQRSAVEEYQTLAMKKSEIERQENKEKTGVFTGAYAINPLNGKKLPIWIADYVLIGYGEGAIMAVPSDDARDREFAETFGLEIVEKYKPTTLEDLKKQGIAEPKTTYRMRDWLISRQRYWGCPIPIAYDKDGNPHAIPEDQLPVTLPEITDYQPAGTGESALAKATDWLKVTIPDEKTGEPLECTRETDTLDGYACSSWYLWRYVSPHDSAHAWSPEAIKYWAPTDIYVGGDHAVAHLLYVRFWCKFFADLGYLPFREPITKLLYNGYINGSDGKKMSKSKGNGVDPLDVIDSGYGADTLRTYEMFIGPYDQAANWDPRSVGGVHRFLNRCWNLCVGALDSETTDSRSEPAGRMNAKVSPEGDPAGQSGANELFAGNPQSRRGLSEEARDDGPDERPANNSLRHSTIKRVTSDLDRHNFNTAVAALMEYVNELYKQGAGREDLATLARLLKPFAPHLASEMLEKLGETDDSWPDYDEKYLQTENIEIIVQVNGKLRARLQIPAASASDPQKVVDTALQDQNVQKYVQNAPKKTIYVEKSHLLNLVV